MIALDPPVRILIFSSCIEGPSTHAPTLQAELSAQLDAVLYSLGVKPEREPA